MTVIYGHQQYIEYYNKKYVVSYYQNRKSSGFTINLQLNFDQAEHSEDVVK